MPLINLTSTWAVVANNQANVAFQVQGGGSVQLMRSNNVAPTSGFEYAPGFGDRGALDTLFPGSTGNPVWGRSMANSWVVTG